MIGQHGQNYIEETIVKFKDLHHIKEPRCRKCWVNFEPEDDVLMFGTRAKRRYYHKGCFKEY